MFMLVSELKSHSKVRDRLVLLDNPSLTSEQIHEREAASRALMLNFILMSTCFSINHGAVVTVIALATAHLGPLLGAFDLAFFNSMYVFTGLVLQSVVVHALGLKKGLFAGCALYCMYVLSFLLAMLMEPGTTGQWRVAIGGALLGGFGAGFLWSAQGAYFTLNAEQYAAVSGEPKEAVTGRLSGIFAFCYLSIEVCMKLLASAVMSSPAGIEAEEAIFTIFTVLAGLSAIGMVWIKDMSAHPADPGATLLTELEGGRPDGGRRLWEEGEEAVCHNPMAQANDEGEGGGGGGGGCSALMVAVESQHRPVAAADEPRIHREEPGGVECGQCGNKYSIIGTGRVAFCGACGWAAAAADDKPEQLRWGDPTSASEQGNGRQYGVANGDGRAQQRAEQRRPTVVGAAVPTHRPDQHHAGSRSRQRPLDRPKAQSADGRPAPAAGRRPKAEGLAAAKPAQRRSMLRKATVAVS